MRVNTFHGPTHQATWTTTNLSFRIQSKSEIAFITWRLILTSRALVISGLTWLLVLVVYLTIWGILNRRICPKITGPHSYLIVGYRTSHRPGWLLMCWCLKISLGRKIWSLQWLQGHRSTRSTVGTKRVPSTCTDITIVIRLIVRHKHAIAASSESAIALQNSLAAQSNNISTMIADTVLRIDVLRII